MTPDAIYRALCSVDPALEAWQRCEHEWKHVTIERGMTNYNEPLARRIWQCFKCGRELRTAESNRHGGEAFGDGKPRYQTVDALLGLCERLDIQITELRRWWSFDHEGWWTKLAVQRNGTGKQEWLKWAEGREVVAALSEAILRAMGKWTEVEK